MSDEWTENDDLAVRREWGRDTGRLKVKVRGEWYSPDELRAFIAELETALRDLET